MLNPPSGITASDFYDIIKSGAPVHAQLVFGSGANTIRLDDEDFDLSAGITVTEVLNGDTNITPGRAVMKQLTARIIRSSKTDSINWTDVFNLRFGIDYNGAIKWTTIDKFIGIQPDNVTTVDVIEFTAYDYMQKFDKLADDYLDSVTYPCTLYNYVNGLCNYAGVSFLNPSPTIPARTFNSAPFTEKGYTCRDILAWIAESIGRYARTYRQGFCMLTWYSDQTTYTITDNEEFNIVNGDLYEDLTWDEVDLYTWDEADKYDWGTIDGYYGIDSLKVSKSNSDVDAIYPRESNWNTYTIIDNPFLDIQSPTDVQNLMKPIYDQLEEFGSYAPVSVECIGNYLVESGDIITVQVGSKYVKLPIYARTLTWRGVIIDEYEVTGTHNWETVTQANKAKIENRRIVQIYTEDEYYHVRSGIVIAPEGITITGSKYINIESGSAINIKSGGNLFVASGGTIDIHASGTLELTGTSVSIKSNSTFDLDSDNFKINSIDKYIHIPVDTDDTWMFDNKGLRLYNSTRQKNVIQFAGEFVGGTTSIPDAGFFAYTPNGDTTHGRTAITAVDRVNSKYGFLYFEYDKSTMGRFMPGVAGTVSLGDTNHKFWEVHTAYLMGSTTGNGLYLCPGGNSNRFMFIYDDTSESCYKILGYTVPPGNTWQSHEVKLYGSVQSISSRYKKHAIEKLHDAGDVIDRLNPVSFAYNSDRTNKTHFGLIYEDTVGILPEICDPGDDKTDKSINYVELVPVLLKEIQSLRKRVEELEEVKA